MATLIAGLDQTVEGYHFFTIAKYGIALAVMLPATFCAGITLPLITHMLMRAGGGERAIGAVYSVNTLGSIVGAAAGLGTGGGATLGGNLLSSITGLGGGK